MADTEPLPGALDPTHPTPDYIFGPPPVSKDAAGSERPQEGHLTHGECVDLLALLREAFSRDRPTVEISLT